MSDHAETVEQRRLFHSAGVIAESSNPGNLARMPDPDARGIIHGCCGDTVGIYLRLNGDRIEEATLTTDGHESAIACASVLTKTVQGLSLEEAYKIKLEDVVTALDGLPEAKIHCAHLTVNTLRQAIDDWRADESKATSG
jgi:nitrogen fixation NifU-like protein